MSNQRLGDKRFVSGLIAVLLVLSSLVSVVGLWLASLEERGFLHRDQVDPWRPVAIAWSVCAVAAAFVIMKARRQTFYADGFSGGTERISRGQMLLSALAVALIGLSLGFKSLSTKLKFVLESQWPQELSADAVKKSFTLHLDCEGCVRSVESFIRKQTLAERAQVSFEAKDLAIWISPGKTTFEAVLHKMALNGYTVSEKRAEAPR